MSAWSYRSGWFGTEGEIVAERVTGERFQFRAYRFPAGWRVSPVHDPCPKSVEAEVRRIARGWW